MVDLATIQNDDGFYDYMKDNYFDTPYFYDWFNELIEYDSKELQNYYQEYLEAYNIKE